jgi:hypothetical protein
MMSFWSACLGAIIGTLVALGIVSLWLWYEFFSDDDEEE